MRQLTTISAVLLTVCLSSSRGVRPGPGRRRTARAVENGGHVCSIQRNGCTRHGEFSGILSEFCQRNEDKQLTDSGLERQQIG